MVRKPGSTLKRPESKDVWKTSWLQFGKATDIADIAPRRGFFFESAAADDGCLVT
jgi:hypothetical protein